MVDDTLENYLRKAAEFHGCSQEAPGVVIGCFMVEYALDLMGDFQGTLNAVVETRVCLSDCVQVMTGCTIGNKRLRLHDHLGRYACALYDRDSGRGVRVFLDLAKIEAAGLSELRAFHTRTRDPRLRTDQVARKESGRRVVDEFRRAGRGVLSYQRVRVNLPVSDARQTSVPCSRCGEPFLTSVAPGAGICPACSGEAYVEAQDGAAGA